MFWLSIKIILSFYFAVQSKDILRKYATLWLKNILKSAHFNFYCAQIGGYEQLKKAGLSNIYIIIYKGDDALFGLFRGKKRGGNAKTPASFANV